MVSAVLQSFTNFIGLLQIARKIIQADFTPVAQSAPISEFELGAPGLASATKLSV